ncbi:WXG100 family type VII secretion target [Actinokineospora guangxiensis]|uniref:WXG100 family type VII secretion target n=1 Tax=Actinokineospora guangxiensis TaxID=1490288 RepID=A0ABW0ESW3_9PSEU
MTGFEVDPGALAARAGEFGDLAERASAIHRDLADRLSSLGTCWGADAVGASFAAAHTPGAEATLGDLGALPGRLGEVGDRLTDTAARYAATEADTTAALGGTDGH